MGGFTNQESTLLCIIYHATLTLADSQSRATGDGIAARCRFPQLLHSAVHIFMRKATSIAQQKHFVFVCNIFTYLVLGIYSYISGPAMSCFGSSSDTVQGSK